MTEFCLTPDVFSFILQIKQTVTPSMMVEYNFIFFNLKCRHTLALAFVSLMISKSFSILFDYSTGERSEITAKINWLMDGGISTGSAT